MILQDRQYVWRERPAIPSGLLSCAGRVIPVSSAKTDFILIPPAPPPPPPPPQKKKTIPPPSPLPPPPLQGLNDGLVTKKG